MGGIYSVESFENEVWASPEEQRTLLGEYARFPQGMPPGFPKPKEETPKTPPAPPPGPLPECPPTVKPSCSFTQSAVEQYYDYRGRWCMRWVCSGW
jgi:hypothetical protein